MTNEETIEVLDDMKIKIDTPIAAITQRKRNEALDKAIKAIEQQPCEGCIRELISEFDNKHPALFADYMQEFNNHPISEIIEYMWDMHDLIEDIRYRLPKAESEAEK